MLKYPAGVEASTFLQAMYDAGVVLADGIGKLAGKVCRIGHMGNIGAQEILQVVTAAERILAKRETPGKAYQTASEALESAELRQSRK